MRISREHIQARMERIAAKLGKPTGTAWVRDGNKNRAIIGNWSLDYNPVYGGYEVQEIVNESGAVKLPLGNGRKMSSEFNDALQMVEFALEIKEGK